MSNWGMGRCIKLEFYSLLWYNYYVINIKSRNYYHRGSVMNELIDNDGACCKDTCCAEGCCSDGCNTGECSNSCCSDGCCSESVNCCAD